MILYFIINYFHQKSIHLILNHILIFINYVLGYPILPFLHHHPHHINLLNHQYHLENY